MEPAKLVDNSCLLRLLNNRGIVAIDVSVILDCSYGMASKRIKTSDFSIVEANILSKHLNIPLADFAEVLEGNKEVLKKHLLP